MAIQLEIIEKSGAWFYYDGERLGQGKDNVRKNIEADTEFMDKLEALIREKVTAGALSDSPVGDGDDEFEIKDFDEEI